MTEQTRQGVPAFWFRQDALSEEESSALLAEKARVAQKCTGRAKKPVLLFPDKVVKGPWSLPKEHERLNRELGRAALMLHWAMPTTAQAVLRSALYVHPKSQGTYLVTPALYQPPGPDNPWVVESISKSVSAVGPRVLEVISRDSLGVVRVADRVKKDPGYLMRSAEVWEHLIHRCLLRCGDSGLHNMLVNPADDKAVGVDFDEWRNTARENPEDWSTLLFKSPPAKKLRPVLNESRLKHRAYITNMLEHLTRVCCDEETQSIIEVHGLDRGNIEERIEWLRSTLQYSGSDSF